jgi:phospholipase/carboxylesterase
MAQTLISSNLVHKIRQPAESGTHKHPALILLHGMGTSEDDLLGIADYLPTSLFIVSARAPFKIGSGSGGYTWYDVSDIGKDIGLPHPQQFEESHSRLLHFILDVKKHYPVDDRRMFLFGFSMGSVIALAVSLTHPEIIRGVVSHSGYIRENNSLEFALDRLRSLSVFIAHGVDDPVIPIRLARRAREILGKTDVDLTYGEYPIAHTICEQSLGDIADWFDGALGVPSD